MLSVKFDCHTHTIASGHAYSTLEENLNSAREKNLEGIVVTEHGPAMPGGPHEIYFMNLHSLPAEYRGIKLLKGIEANVIDYDGNIDLPVYPLKKLDFCIASYHEICIAPSNERDHTRGWLSVIENPYVDLLGHPGRGRFPFDIQAIVTACKEHNKAIEINNHTLDRDRDKQMCLEIALACKEQGVMVMANSDSHFSPSIGEVDRSLKLLQEIDFPQQLIANRTWDSLRGFLKRRGREVI